jgi:hypothetical protein
MPTKTEQNMDYIEDVTEWGLWHDNKQKSYSIPVTEAVKIYDLQLLDGFSIYRSLLF